MSRLINFCLDMSSAVAARSPREAKSATVGKTATAKMQSESEENWVPTRFHVGPFVGPSLWPVLKNLLLSIPERSRAFPVIL